MSILFGVAARASGGTYSAAQQHASSARMHSVRASSSAAEEVAQRSEPAARLPSAARTSSAAAAALDGGAPLAPILAALTRGEVAHNLQFQTFQTVSKRFKQFHTRWPEPKWRFSGAQRDFWRPAPKSSQS